MKIGVIDDGIDARHVFFDPIDVLVPVRVPEGADLEDDAEGDRAARVRAELAGYGLARSPFDPSQNGSFHATHVAGIAAGDHNTQDGALFLSGVAPDAFLGNYKALTIPTPGFGLDGNSARSRRRSRLRWRTG